MQTEIRTYAELQQQMRDALREQHPEWIGPDGDCPTCHIYERRFAELLALFGKAFRKKPMDEEGYSTGAESLFFDRQR
jgi:hypothetical protein